MEIFYRELPLHMVNILISGLHPTTGVYISIFKVDLAGIKRLIELRYGMNITAFNEKGINVLRSQNIILVELSRKFPLDFKERVSVVVIYSWDQAK